MIKKNNGYIAIREFEIKQAESAENFPHLSACFILFYFLCCFIKPLLDTISALWQSLFPCLIKVRIEKNRI